MGGLIHALLEVLHFGNAFFSRLGLVLFILRVPEARGVLFGVLRRDTDNQIKINRQLSGLRSFQGFEFLDEHVFYLGILDSIDGAVFLDSGIALHIKLCGQHLVVAPDDREMNMLCSAAIRRWLNSSEIVFAGTTCNKTAVPLEILVAGWAFGGFRMDVYSLIIHLPDFHNSISDWISFVV